ncbi:MAG: RNA-binding protein [bacterium]
MSNKLFVGGLSWGTESDSLRAAFEQYGTVSDAVVISDRDTGRSRGFGFVTFENLDDANAAIAAMDQSDLDGRTLNVNMARDRR